MADRKFRDAKKRMKRLSESDQFDVATISRKPSNRELNERIDKRVARPGSFTTKPGGDLLNTEEASPRRKAEALRRIKRARKRAGARTFSRGKEIQ